MPDLGTTKMVIQLTPNPLFNPSTQFFTHFFLQEHDMENSKQQNHSTKLTINDQINYENAFRKTGARSGNVDFTPIADLILNAYLDLFADLNLTQTLLYSQTRF